MKSSAPKTCLSEKSLLKEMLIVFGALNLVFAYYQITFFIGNHDWDWVKGTNQVLSLNTGLFEGRYGKFVLNVMLFGGQILPIANTFTAFFLLASGAVLISFYWQKEASVTRLITALLISLAPFILGWLYFSINIIGNFSAVLLVAAGLILSRKESLLTKAAAVICFLYALGIYPSVAETMLVCCCFRFIITPPETKKELFGAFAVILASLIIFKLILFFLAKFNIIYAGHYNLQTASLTEMLQQLPASLKLIWAQMIITLPFFPLSYKLVSFSLVIAAILASTKKPVHAVLWLGALAATVLSTSLAASVEEVAYMPRVNFYGLNFLYAGSAAVLLQKKAFWRNIGFGLSIILLFISITENLNAQKVWQLGKTAEERLIGRVIARTEGKARAVSEKPQIGILTSDISLRPRYYAGKFRKNSPYILKNAFIIRHIPAGMINFYMPTPLITTTSQIRNITPALYDYLAFKATPYPSEEALYIDSEYIIINLNSEGIAAIRAQLPH